MRRSELRLTFLEFIKIWLIQDTDLISWINYYFLQNKEIIWIIVKLNMENKERKYFYKIKIEFIWVTVNSCFHGEMLDSFKKKFQNFCIFYLFV